MIYQFDYRPYQRKFKHAVVTSHGIWEKREGIILRFVDEAGIVSWGEIAPISWFGSETLEQALDFCYQLPREITEETIFSIPDQLPASQFGFESVIWRMGHVPKTNTYSALLPAGEAALESWQALCQQGYSTFKWKIGVYPTSVELEILELLISQLPASAKVRLDANGGLSTEEANLWLASCDKINAIDLPVKIEFLEQPLSVDQFSLMLEFSRRYQTAIALDESVATLRQLECCFQQGWRGIFVIKPVIIGSPSRLRQFYQQHNIDAVFSSGFETIIGRKAALQLAAELSHNNRAVGFGINHYFGEDDAIWLKNLW